MNMAPEFRQPYKPRPAGSAHEVVSALYSDMGGPERVAWLLNKKTHVVRSWSDPEQAHGGIPLEHAARLTQISGSLTLPDFVAAHGGGFVVQAAPVAGDWHDLTSATARLCGDLVARLVVLGRNLDRRQGREALMLTHELQRMLVTLRAHLVEIARSDSS